MINYKIRLVPDGTPVYYITGSCPEYRIWEGTIEDFVVRYDDSDRTRLTIKYRIGESTRGPSSRDGWHPNNRIFLALESAQQALADMRENYYKAQIKFNEIFYRVEDSEGQGPYTYIDNQEPKIFEYTLEYYTTDEYLKRVPTPKDDGFPITCAPFLDVQDSKLNEVDWRTAFVNKREFGFSTKEQVQRWFTPGEFAFLEDNGFHLYLVYGQALHRSENQVQYIRDKTKRRVKVTYD
jgi:hypothetical protein